LSSSVTPNSQGFALVDLIVASKKLPGAELERRVGLPADRTWDVDTIAPGGGRWGNSGASYASGLSTSLPIEDHIVAFVSRLDAVRERVGELFRSSEPIYGRLSLTCTTPSSFWELSLTSQQLEFFSTLGTPLIMFVNLPRSAEALP